MKGTEVSKSYLPSFSWESLFPVGYNSTKFVENKAPLDTFKKDKERVSIQ